MRAVVLKGYGGPEVLQYEEVADPTPAAGQVLLKVHACGVCGFDCKCRGGLPGYHTGPGAILGHEFAGEVIGVGPGVTDYAVGDRVAVIQQGYCGKCEFCLSGNFTQCPHHHETTYGSLERPGGYAEMVAADVATTVKIPDGVSWRDAAIAACGIGVVLHALNRARMKMGDHVLVTGAGGGLGIHALQLARLAGCRVTAATSSESKVELLQRYADEVVMYRNGKFELGEDRPNIIVENTAGITLPASLKAIRRGGRIVIAGMVGTDPVPIMPGPFFVREIEMLGSNGTTLLELSKVLELLAQRKLEAVVSQELPLSNAALAHQLVENKAVLGRVVLVPDSVM